MVEIRDAAVTDAEAIVQLTAAGWRAAYPGILPAERIESLPIAAWRHDISHGLAEPEGHSFTRVAEEGGAIAGYVYVAAPGRETEDEGEAELVAIYVSPGHWRRGIGRALMEAAVSDARAAGYARLALWSFEQNAQALAFYGALGWQLTEQRRPHRATGTPTVKLKRELG